MPGKTGLSCGSFLFMRNTGNSGIGLHVLQIGESATIAIWKKRSCVLSELIPIKYR